MNDLYKNVYLMSTLDPPPKWSVNAFKNGRKLYFDSFEREKKLVHFYILSRYERFI